MRIRKMTIFYCFLADQRRFIETINENDSRQDVLAIGSILTDIVKNNSQNSNLLKGISKQG